MNISLRRAEMYVLGNLLAVSLSLFFVFTPIVAHAQSDLRTTIRAAIMADPRASSMSSADIDAIVNALATNAQRQGVSAQDIAWHPLVAPAEGMTDAGSSAMFGYWYVMLMLLLMVFLVIMAAIMERMKGRPSPI